MDNRILINSADIEILDDKIIFNKTNSLKSINFAACQTYSEDFIISKPKDIKTFNLPPIYYKKDELGYQFMIDMFNNDYIFSNNKKIGLPVFCKF